MKGQIHSIESMGLVDGPGIRTVVFMQGCSLRCKFCHNCDSWDMQGGEQITADALMKRILRFRPYFERSGGGVTFTGGEPLLQPEFLLEMLKRCKSEGIHTCLDTAGAGLGDYDEILKYTDLVMFDVKATEANTFKSLCSAEMDRCKAFINALNTSKCSVRVRAVIIPGINDTEEYMHSLYDYIKKELPMTEEVELLPFHKMGAHKYASLGLDDPLANTPAMDKERTKELKKFFTERGYR